VRRNGLAIAARRPDQRKRELPIQRMGNSDEGLLVDFDGSY
jgi:hypothetical protein